MAFKTAQTSHFRRCAGDSVSIPIPPRERPVADSVPSERSDRIPQADRDAAIFEIRHQKLKLKID